MGIVLFYAFLIIMLNTVVDIVLTLLNPRLRIK
jgi:ABC-type dipeptide/oligopeptide/nickel transport system permease component